jgi:nucleotide-binding universal stress UspA family protein
MKKILVPTDLSDIAELGLKLAVEIAKRSSANISIVNFMRHPWGATFSATGDATLRVDKEGDYYAIELLKTTKEKMEMLVAKYIDTGISMDVAVIDSEFKNGIDEYLQAESIDLVVMGTSGEERGKEAFIGNHAEQTIKVSSCPVLSVRDGFDINDFNNIVVAVNVITDNQLADGLISIRNLAECFNSHTHLVHVRDNSSDTNIILDEYFSQMAQIAGLTNYSVVIIEADNLVDGVSEYADQVRAGLIAVIKNRKDGIFRIFSNHFSNHIVKEEGRPVITVNLQNTEN